MERTSGRGRSIGAVGASICSGGRGAGDPARENPTSPEAVMSTPTATLPPEVPVSDRDANHARRWWILAVLGVAQLMVILDNTIVNIALPTAQHALHFSNADRQWVVTGYSLAFGGLRSE